MSRWTFFSADYLLHAADMFCSEQLGEHLVALHNIKC